MYVSQTSYVADMCSCGGKRTYSRVLIISSTHVIQIITTTVKNPQANAICERLHQSISNTLRTMLHAYPPNTIDQTNDIMDTCFATAAYASKVAKIGRAHV